MDPEERADASALGARRHIWRYFKDRLEVPRASIIDAKDGEVLGFYIVDVRLVRDCETTATDVVDVVRMDRRGGLTRACEVRVVITNVSAA